MSAMPEDIIAQAVRLFIRTEGAGRVGSIAVADLTAAGYRILGPGELDRETLERAAQDIENRDFPLLHDGVVVEIAAAIRSLTGEAK